MTGIELKDTKEELEFVIDRFYDFPKETNVTNSINNVQNAINAINELEDYYAVGTVEECREAMERQRGKKPIMKPFYEDMEEEYLCCPTCGDILTDRMPMDNKDFYFHCLNCGQKLDWSE